MQAGTKKRKKLMLILRWGVHSSSKDAETNECRSSLFMWILKNRGQTAPSETGSYLEGFEDLPSQGNLLETEATTQQHQLASSRQLEIVPQKVEIQ